MTDVAAVLPPVGTVPRRRLDGLVEAGVPERLALRLAFDDELDWRRVAELVKRGCPPITAWRIVR